jgi:hypothetical protein
MVRLVSPFPFRLLGDESAPGSGCRTCHAVTVGQPVNRCSVAFGLAPRLFHSAILYPRSCCRLCCFRTRDLCLGCYWIATPIRTHLLIRYCHAYLPRELYTTLLYLIFKFSEVQLRYNLLAKHHYLRRQGLNRNMGKGIQGIYMS